MEPHSAADAYRRSTIENAPPVQVVRLLYQGALQFLERARREDAADVSSRFLYWIGRADAIVTELRLAIDHSVGEELTRDLERLYLFCEDELGRAGLERSPAPIDGVVRVLETLLDAWKHVEVEASAV